ncbi:hypothetical protein KJS94_11230 [Flavihumibacter rivuli]|uniref:hypothetical protein n=1 Tax=Flavihumibacter rivuli TaxID=2838156 RepID=UPI001BDE4C67|nr:hypothetical protein [Flavihumibacter rivuli]ULQ55214.1 hypothetical protein KJS94_11230 [Flavihumibacter rivuli]
MAFENRFSEEEQVLLSSLPTLVGSVMSFAAGSGLGTIKEMFSSAKSYMAGAADFSGNEIITGILPNMNDRDGAMQEARDLKAKIQSHFKGYEAKSKEELRQHVLDDCRKVNEILSQKANLQEAEEYKKWTLNIAENVAKAASEGGFLGFGGTQVSEGEINLFDEIATALNVSRKL